MTAPVRSTVIVDALRQAGLLVEVRGELPHTFTSITDDSRAATLGTLFVAVQGSSRDGHEFL